MDQQDLPYNASITFHNDVSDDSDPHSCSGLIMNVYKSVIYGSNRPPNNPFPQHSIEEGAKQPSPPKKLEFVNLNAGVSSIKLSSYKAHHEVLAQTEYSTS